MQQTAKADPGSERPISGPAGNAAKEPLPRSVYVAMRLREISAQIQAGAQERQALTADLQISPPDRGDGAKALRQRRAYVAQRLAVLRSEQAGLIAERKG